MIGAGGDELAPTGIDLREYGPAFVVVGPHRSGRSTTLVTMARSLLAAGTPVLLVAPRRSPLRELAGADGVLGVITETEQEDVVPPLIAGHDRYVVLVDDAELVNETELDTQLTTVLRAARDADHAMIIAGTNADLQYGYGNFIAEARKSRTGLLLAVTDTTDGESIGVKLPRNVTPGPAGRALLAAAATLTPIQCATP